VTRRTNQRRPVAVALAGAFLDGAWEPAAMARRGRRALAPPPDRPRGGQRWVRELAEMAVRAFPDRPSDAPRALAELLAAGDAFAGAFAARDRSAWPRARRWSGTPTAMAPARWPVPHLPDLVALASWLGVTPGHLAWFADVRSYERTAPDEPLRHYRRCWVTKPDGSARLLEAPKRELKDLQRQVLHHVLDRVPAHPAAHGFRPGRSALTAAAPHVGRTVVVRLDMEAFFAHVAVGRVYGLFRLLGYPEPVAHTLAGLCTTVTPLAARREAPPAPQAARAAGVERRRRLLAALAVPHLAQGSPTSPALANLVAHNLDRRLAALARRLGGTYTRYADDLVVSGGPALARRADGLAHTVAEIVADEGFRLHPAKTRVRTAAQRQVVTGLVVNARPNVARSEVDRLRAVLHDAARSGPEAANREGHPDFRSHLRGRIAWVAAANPDRAPKLEAAFAAIAWPEG